MRLFFQLPARKFPLLLLAILLLARAASAQWATESYPLKAGWNAIWLPLDCTYDAVDKVLAQPAITEVWRWNPLDSTTQFTVAPASPIAPDIQWAVWRRDDPTNSTLGTLTGNAAYLVKVADGTAAFTLALKGRPLPPAQTWKSSGLNFGGFPLAGTPSFSNFLAKSADLKNSPAIYQYVGGALSNVVPKNPVLVTSPGIATMSRGAAYWIQSTNFSAYNGPLSVTVSGGRGVNFGETGNLATVHVVNATDPAQKTSVGVTFTSATSEQPPVTTPAQEASAGTVPLRVRGALDPATGQFTYTDFTAPVTRTLAPGESTDFVVLVNRTALGTTAGAVFQSLIQVTDSLNLTSINVPVRAVATSFAGLWVGAASVTNVDEVLARGPVVTTKPTQPTQPRAAFPVRLLLHATAGGTTTLLPQVFLGNAANGTPKASTQESVVKATATSRIARLSSAAFPLEMPVTTSGGGVGLSNTLTYTVTLPFDSATNPFLHAYHPDHDNLDARFAQKLANKAESYTVTRVITLAFQPSLAGVSETESTWGSTTLGGTYTETISGLRQQDLHVSGVFVLHRVSDVPTLSP